MSSGYTKSEQRIALTVGDSLKVARELQELSQSDLSKLSNIRQSIIIDIENNKIFPEEEQANQLASVLKIHPTILLSPDWEKKQV